MTNWERSKWSFLAQGVLSIFYIFGISFEQFMFWSLMNLFNILYYFLEEYYSEEDS